METWRLVEMITEIPMNAWRYSQRRPYGAFLWGACILFGSLASKVALASLGTLLIVGAVVSLYRNPPGIG